MDRMDKNHNGEGSRPAAPRLLRSEDVSRDSSALHDVVTLIPFAVRYTLGRRSYAVSEITDICLRYRDALPRTVRNGIVRDIAMCDNLGDDVDAALWERVRAAMMA
jgi:hypothetical protein